MSQLQLLQKCLHSATITPALPPRRHSQSRAEYNSSAERPLVCRATGAEAVAEPPDTQHDTGSAEDEERNGSVSRLKSIPIQAWLQRTRPAQVLDGKDVYDALINAVHSRAQSHYKAFYSSDLGGIVVDPALMILSIDDHMVHRGHAVFDTAEIHHGHLYALDAHFQRFLLSAARAGIDLPVSDAQMYRIILETAAASRSFYGSVRYWLSAGRGGFGLSPQECIKPIFYVMAYTKEHDPPAVQTKGLRVCSSPVPCKDSYSATVKSTNYLLNAMNLLDAQVAGCDQGIFVDDFDYVLEGPNMNLGIVTQDNELVVPTFARVLRGITITRLLDLLPTYIERGDVNLKAVSERNFTKWEAFKAKEVFLTGSSIKVRGITQWDDNVISNGRVGEVTLQLHSIIDQDMESGLNILTTVPYGYLTASGDWID